MDKKQKILIIVGGTVALYILAILVFWIAVKIKERRRDDGSSGGEKDTSNEGGSSGGSSQQPSMPSSPMKWGSGIYPSDRIDEVRNNVKQLQKLCNKWCGAGIFVDGKWGDNTEAAMQKLRNACVVPKRNASGEYFGAKHPFTEYINPVQVPLASQSRVQVYVAHATTMVKWSNEHQSEYRPV